MRYGTDPNAKGHVDDEITAFIGLGVDALFADYPDTAVSAREEWLEG